ncbi:MAG: ExeM/NucH family extracellular endonuclease [Woeseiaceae bacterium]|jgi:predicted extracellular nuclease|nr:ExeM/NucH family extracellular endonuclease [Woeseiaceae bacterium]
MNRLAALLLPLLAACEPAATTSAPLVAVHAVQGSGDESPYTGQTVRVRGVVTGDFQDDGSADDGGLGGFFIASIEPDGDPASSDGVFVFQPQGGQGDITTGDVVEVTGRVVEHFGETQIVAEGIARGGTAAVEPVDLSFPVDDFERYEGMLVTVPEPLVIAGNRNLGRFGSLLLAAGERPYQYTNREAPDRDGYRAAGRRLETLSVILDDGSRGENPDPVRYAGGKVPPRSGNTIRGLTGNVRWSRGSGDSGDPAYRIMPTAEPVIEPGNPRTPPPERSGNLRVVSFNLLNLFSGLDDGNPTCGPRGDAACRGADTKRERERQLAKTVTALRYLDADIVGVAEIENNARESMELLVSALGADGQSYRYVDTGAIGDDSIRVGFLYRPAAVTPVGEYALLTRAVDGRFDDRRNRPALAQTFRLDANGALLTVIANHLKSKGSDCDEVNDPNLGDGQGNCNRTRTYAAAALAEWSQGDPTGTGTKRALVIGDLNAYLREDPIRALENGGLVNLLDRDRGDLAYSYVYSGRAGALDHALATPALAGRVLRAGAWHSNADEPALYDYNLDFGRDPGLFDAATPWRSSDHDPVVVDIELDP